MYSVSWLIFSWVIFSWFRLHFDSVNGVFVHGVGQFSVDLRFLEPAPLPCKFPSVSTPGFAESTFVQDLVFVVWSVVVSWILSAPTAFPVRAPVYRGCPCRDPSVCHRVRDDSVAKRQPLCVCVGWSRVVLRSVRSHSWSCLTVTRN